MSRTERTASMRRRFIALVLCAVMAIAVACTVGIGDEPHVPLVGGVYQYSATTAEDGAIIFAGTLVLQEGPHGELGGSYRLPGQCSTAEGETADCQGRVVGQRNADLSLAFDFDTERFHHTGTLDRDGVIRGLWIFTFVDTLTADTSRAAGPFTGVPVR